CHPRGSLRGSGYRRRSIHPARLLLFALLGAVLLGSAEITFPLLIAAMLVGGTVVLFRAAGATRRQQQWQQHWRAEQAWFPPPAVPVPSPRAAPDWRGEWRTARRRFDALRGEYAGYECDPLAVLRLPALADVTVPATARFVDAFAEAQALDTDAVPPAGHAAKFGLAVDRACRSWQAARDAADRIRLAGLSPEERSSVQRVIKLLTMANASGNDAERLAAYAKARAELARLERAGRIHLPRAATAALDASARTGLPAGFAVPGAPDADTEPVADAKPA
ncbi:MAG: hypothetical protein QOK26_1118, partial [Pseudonocardiales bacterium]|nr:hypothetical protein [Pseudonocardiales bacterium]